MRILVFGGTAFLSHATALAAASRGHRVTCVARGVSGSVPEGVGFVRWDRDEPMPDGARARLLDEGPFDAVVDVSGNPEHVGPAVEEFRDAHWVFVSSVSAYTDHSVAHGTPSSTPVHEPLWGGRPDTTEAYGALKVACELAAAAARRTTIVRPGLVVGPDDPSGRFASWLPRVRSAATRGEPFLAPLPTDAPVQWIDVRDLADWLVTVVENGTTGTFDAVGPAVPIGEFADDLGALFGASPRWVASSDLETADVRPWTGPRSISLWVPWPGWEGFLARDAAPAIAAGLRLRPLAETVAAIVDAHDEGEGLTPEEEREVLDALPGVPSTDVPGTDVPGTDLTGPGTP